MFVIFALEFDMDQTSQAIQDKRIQVVSFDLPVVQVGRFVFRFPFELSSW
jgi:hypothetical protein